jgi:ATP-binding cassette, subfamily B, multidrug efflux pump
MSKSTTSQPPGGGMHGPGSRPSDKPKNARKTIMRMLRYLGSNPLKLFLAVILVILSALAGVFATWYLKPIINGIKEGAQLSSLAGFLINMAAIYLASVVLAYVSSLMIVRIAQGTSNRIRKELFEHMMDLPVNYFDIRSHGEIMSRFTNDVDNINVALEQSLSQLITSAITVAGVFIMMLLLSPFLTIFVILFLIVMLWIINTVGKKSSQYFRSQQKSLGELNGVIEELIEGQKVIKVFQREQHAKEDFRKKNEVLRQAATEAQTFAGILMPIMGNLSYAHYAVTVMVGAILAIQGRIDIGTIAAFLQYTRSFSMPITQIANQFNTLIAALAGAERIFEVLDSAIETDNGTIRLVNAKAQELRNSGGKSISDASFQWVWELKADDGTKAYVPLRGDIRFNDVTFNYIPEKSVLKSISFFAKPGQKLAFVGSTGAGKTTITNLINRFYTINSGQIIFDGIDISRINKSDLRRSLGMVLQDVHLFQGTVRENIRYGNLDATDEDIVRAAKLANAHSFIMKLPSGYDTVLSHDGTSLSQGQRQLLSIARAAVADPPVLILDEATSSVDTHTEKLIEAGMDKLMQGRTTLVIAHRLSTVRNANAIMVLENGEIIERGSHSDLLGLCGRYCELYTGASELA